MTLAAQARSRSSDSSSDGPATSGRGMPSSSSFPLVAWLYLTPPLESMKTFEAWWIAIVFARNLGFTVLLFGAWHLWFYVFKAQGTHTKYTLRPLARNNKVFAFNNQLADNIFWCLCSGVPIWTAYEVVCLWLFANGYVPFIELRTDPVWFVIFMLLIPLIRECSLLLRASSAALAAALRAGPQGASPQRQCRPVGRHVDAPGGARALLLRRAPAPGHSLAPAAHDVPPAPRLALTAPQGHHGFESFGRRGQVGDLRRLRPLPPPQVFRVQLRRRRRPDDLGRRCSAPGTTAPTRPTSA